MTATTPPDDRQPPSVHALTINVYLEYGVSPIKVVLRSRPSYCFVGEEFDWVVDVIM